MFITSTTSGLTYGAYCISFKTKDYSVAEVKESSAIKQSTVEVVCYNQDVERRSEYSWRVRWRTSGNFEIKRSAVEYSGFISSIIFQRMIRLLDVVSLWSLYWNWMGNHVDKIEEIRAFPFTIYIDKMFLRPLQQSNIDTVLCFMTRERRLAWPWKHCASQRMISKEKYDGDIIEWLWMVA